jgi:bifunctional non-homologous end joining protein LigD
VSLQQYHAKRKVAPKLKPSGVNLGDAPKAPMLRNVQPMLASPTDQPFDHPDWIFEVKWDGYRAIAEIKDGRVRLYSRNMLSFDQRYSPVVSSLQRLGHDAVLDGEIVVLDQTGKPRFQLLHSSVPPPVTARDE